MTTYTLKEIFILLKENVFSESDIKVIPYLETIRERSNLSLENLKEIYDTMLIWHEEEMNPTYTHTSRGKDWQDGELKVIYLFEKNFKKEKVMKKGKLKLKGKGEMLKELEEILIDRTVSAISFQYYNNEDIREMRRRHNRVKKETLTLFEDNQEVENNEIDLSAFEEEDVDLTINRPMTFEYIEEPFAEVLKNEEEVKYEVIKGDNSKEQETKEDIDLIDSISEFVENMENVGLDVNPFFASLLTMSQRAVENSNLERIHLLEDSIKNLNEELNEQRQRNKQIQSDFMRLYNDFLELKKEIIAFNNMPSKDRLKNMNTHSDKLRFMIDQFGGVMAFGV
jgi:uncharacterized coiled-coil protein SlyX